MAPRVERRVASDDGNKYTQAEFVQFYGVKAGAKRWEAAAPKAKAKSSKQYDYSALEKGASVQAEVDGKWWVAEVLTVSQKPDSAAPVKVRYVGYTKASDEWLGGDRLRSKAMVLKGNNLAPGSVKLHYWPARGRGEQVRLALAATNVSFEDVTFDMSDDAEKQAFFEKCRGMGGNLTSNTPMLELDGKFYTQSTAIVKFVCARGGLRTRSAAAAFEVDNVIAHVEDIRSICYKPIKLLGGSMTKEEFVAASDKHLQNLERLLGDKKYFVENRLTAADISVYDLLDTMIETQLPGRLDSLPKLAAFRDRLSKVKGIAAYHETDQHKKLWAFPAL